MNRRPVLIAVLLVASSVLLTGCASTNEHALLSGQGFWNGLWDGVTCGIAFIGNLFGAEWGVYETRNNGGWYDFGFVLGIGGIFGGGGAAVSNQ